MANATSTLVFPVFKSHARFSLFLTLKRPRYFYLLILLTYDHFDYLRNQLILIIQSHCMNFYFHGDDEKLCLKIFVDVHVLYL